jgi:hypothetical protein
VDSPVVDPRTISLLELLGEAAYRELEQAKAAEGSPVTPDQRILRWEHVVGELGGVAEAMVAHELARALDLEEGAAIDAAHLARWAGLSTRPLAQFDPGLLERARREALGHNQLIRLAVEDYYGRIDSHVRRMIANDQIYRSPLRFEPGATGGGHGYSKSMYLHGWCVYLNVDSDDEPEFESLRDAIPARVRDRTRALHAILR